LNSKIIPSTPFKYLLAWLSFPTEYHKYLYQIVSWFLFFPKDFQPSVPEILLPRMPIRKYIWESWGCTCNWLVEWQLGGEITSARKIYTPCLFNTHKWLEATKDWPHQ
jgi:hypothetical protein